MKLTLVYPGIGGKGFRSVGQGMDGGWISHGLCCLAPVARQAGCAVDLIDLRALDSWDHFRQEILARRPDVVGLTMMSVDYEPVTQCLNIIKDAVPDTISVVGGPHPTILPEEVLENPRVDYIVVGEGEIAFPRLLQAIAAGERPTDRRLDGEHPDLDAMPFADRDLFLHEWRKAGYDMASPEVSFCPELPDPFVTVIAGRGCRYNCSFCKPAENYLFGKGTRRRSVGNVIEELRWLKERYHFRSFMFHDDCLTEDRRWVAEFCQAYQQAGFREPFFCQSRADIIVLHEDMVALMAQAGLRGYFIGFESGNDRVLRFLRKGTTRQRNIEAARICRRYGISIWANYMLGIPTETQEEALDTISMLKVIDPDYYSPAFFTPHPGSDLYDYCREHDLSLITSHDQYRRNPTEPKVKGQDYEFLRWAVVESQRRTLPNAARRRARYLWKRYASPRKAVRKLRRLVGVGTLGVV